MSYRCHVWLKLNKSQNKTHGPFHLPVATTFCFLQKIKQWTRSWISKDSRQFWRRHCTEHCDWWVSPEISDELITPKLLLLPKVHQGTNPPPGRPITSANGCTMEKVSQFVDHLLGSHLHHPQIICNTTHFLQMTLGNCQTTAILVTMDTSSL